MPYVFFWSLMLLILLIGVFIGNSKTDINVHDTYFVVSALDLSMLIAANFFFIGWAYYTLMKLRFYLFPWLNKMHQLGTLIGALGFSYAMHHQVQLLTQSQNPYFDSLSVSLFFFILIMAQLLFPINVFAGLIKKGFKRS